MLLHLLTFLSGEYFCQDSPFQNILTEKHKELEFEMKRELKLFQTSRDNLFLDKGLPMHRYLRLCCILYAFCMFFNVQADWLENAAGGIVASLVVIPVMKNSYQATVIFENAFEKDDFKLKNTATKEAKELVRKMCLPKTYAEQGVISLLASIGIYSGLTTWKGGGLERQLWLGLVTLGCSYYGVLRPLCAYQLHQSSQIKPPEEKKQKPLLKMPHKTKPPI